MAANRRAFSGNTPILLPLSVELGGRVTRRRAGKGVRYFFAPELSLCPGCLGDGFVCGTTGCVVTFRDALVVDGLKVHLVADDCCPVLPGQCRAYLQGGRPPVGILANGGRMRKQLMNGHSARLTRRAVVVIAVSMFASSLAQAQEQQPRPPADHAHATEAISTNFPSREASGTAWLPDLTPMYGFHRQAADWELMFHGNAFGQFLYESGQEHRRSKQAGSINWLMGMARHPAGRGVLALRGMISLEPWTISGCGYPNLLATGEVCRGDTIHDKQHPHDLFMELAADYDRPLTGTLRWQIYAGAVGEPAIGPAGFPHRLSAFSNPIAPISHHWLDATHITFGVLTTGVYAPRWKLEASAFNGREPDAERTDFDLARFDSVAVRLSLMPNERLALQVSGGHLHEAEAGVSRQPRADVNRVTTSATYHRRLGERGLWATTLAYGVNSEMAIIPGGVLDEVTHAVLLESSATRADRHTWFGRLEIVGKAAHDLHAHEYITSIFTVGKLEAGYVRHLRAWKGLLPGLGGVFMASAVPALLAPRYGGRIAPGFGLFVTIRPLQHQM